jgi:hypothetical protein
MKEILKEGGRKRERKKMWDDKGRLSMHNMIRGGKERQLVRINL